MSDQCKIAEKEKKEAETKLEVLSKFFKEKEAERQKQVTINFEGNYILRLNKLLILRLF